MTQNRDAIYLKMVIEPIRVCASYKPKFGRGRSKGLVLSEFQSLYQADPFYAWFGLDNPLMYAAHKAAGGMTSVYRQIGIGCEKLFRQILSDQFGLSPEATNWSYTMPTPGGKTRTLHLDGRVALDDIQDIAARKRFHDWMEQAARAAGVSPAIFASLTGTVFEVRQGYKSKDSKRQNADIANAATAYTNTYLPCAVILSAQIDGDILLRYRSERWSIITGVTGINDPLQSTYDFMAQVVGYDLMGFFQRNSTALRTEIDSVLRDLLAPETP
ncbi:MAG: hypothetical protein HQL80_03715 [Magnetococcales bacterium]|nr:hypothetical protein [Magnetococcales bacterium]